MVNRNLPSRKRMKQPYLIWHVATKRNADLAGNSDHRIEHLPRKTFVHLGEIVAGLVILADQLLTQFWRSNSRPSHRCASQKKAWPESLSPGDLVAHSEM